MLHAYLWGCLQDLMPELQASMAELLLNSSPECALAPAVELYHFLEISQCSGVCLQLHSRNAAPTPVHKRKYITHARRWTKN